MDNKDMISKENDRDEARPLDAEELSKVNGGWDIGDKIAGLTYTRRCYQCKAVTPHTPSSNGGYICNYCNTKNW